MREFMSLNTVRALAFNIASAGINNWLCNKLEIKLSDSVGSIFK